MPLQGGTGDEKWGRAPQHPTPSTQYPIARERSGRLTASLNPRRVLVIAAVFIVGYFGVSIVGNSITRYEQHQHHARLRSEIARLEVQQSKLNALRAYMESDEFIERSGREQGLVRPGDIAVMVAARGQPPAPVVAAGAPWWERYFGAEQR